jgi:hypothetical protein
MTLQDKITTLIRCNNDLNCRDGDKMFENYTASRMTELLYKLVSIWTKTVRDTRTSQADKWYSIMSPIKNAFNPIYGEFLKQIKKTVSMFWITEGLLQFQKTEVKLGVDIYSYIRRKESIVVDQILTGNTKEEVEATIEGLVKGSLPQMSDIYNTKHEDVKLNIHSDKSTQNKIRCTKESVKESIQKGRTNDNCTDKTCPFSQVHKVADFAIFEFLNNKEEKEPVILCCAEANGQKCKRKKCNGVHGIKLESRLYYPAAACRCYLFGVGCTKQPNMAHKEIQCLAHKTNECKEGINCKDIHIRGSGEGKQLSFTAALKYPGTLIRQADVVPRHTLVVYTDTHKENRKHTYINTLENVKEPISPAITTTILKRLIVNTEEEKTRPSDRYKQNTQEASTSNNGHHRDKRDGDNGEQHTRRNKRTYHTSDNVLGEQDRSRREPQPKRQDIGRKGRENEKHPRDNRDRNRIESQLRGQDRSREGREREKHPRDNRDRNRIELQLRGQDEIREERERKNRPNQDRSGKEAQLGEQNRNGEERKLAKCSRNNQQVIENPSTKKHANDDNKTTTVHETSEADNSAMDANEEGTDSILNVCWNEAEVKNYTGR